MIALNRYVLGLRFYKIVSLSCKGFWSSTLTCNDFVDDLPASGLVDLAFAVKRMRLGFWGEARLVAVMLLICRHIPSRSPLRRSSSFAERYALVIIVDVLFVEV